jgi:hypothetical protein
VIHAGVFAREIRQQIKDPAVIEIAENAIGSIDQFIDSTDVLAQTRYYERLKTMYLGD